MLSILEQYLVLEECYLPFILHSQGALLFLRNSQLTWIISYGTLTLIGWLSRPLNKIHETLLLSFDIINLLLKIFFIENFLPFRSPLLWEYQLVSFPLLNNMLKFSRYSTPPQINKSNEVSSTK